MNKLNPNTITFPNTFLDYIPDPPMGNSKYKEGLEQSFISNQAMVPPIYGLLKVTDRCSSHCSYCAHAGNTDQSSEANREILEGVLEQMAEIGVVSVNLTGGEPLLRDDIFHISRYAKKCGLFSILLTNGLLLRKRIEEIAAAELGMVIVSIDSIHAQNYRKTRGSHLDPVLDGIEALLELGNHTPVVTVTSVINRHNLHDLAETIEYFSSRNIGVEVCPYHHHGRWEDDQLSPQNPQDYIKVIDGLKKMKDNHVGIINSHTYLDNFVDFSFKRQKMPGWFRCYAGFTTLYIDAKLNMRSCWSQGLPVAGNLKKHRLKDLLGNEKMLRMRKKIRRLQCERCWLLCTAEVSLRWQ